MSLNILAISFEPSGDIRIDETTITHACKITSASPEEKVGKDDSVNIPPNACLTVELSSSLPAKNAIRTLTALEVFRIFKAESRWTYPIGDSACHEAHELQPKPVTRRLGKREMGV
jgi:hypothetical protein